MTIGQAQQPTLSAQAAQQELARREQARRHLIHYAEYMAPWYSTQPFHKMVATELEEVEKYVVSRGRIGNGRLIIQLPPRYGKTEEVSRLFPSWFLGRNPNMRVILTSYGASLADDNSRAVREYVRNPSYEAIFGSRATVDVPVTISQDSRAVAGWDLAFPHRGGLAAAGVGGGITGKGAHLLIPDDLFKDQEQAESEAYREQVWKWWSAVALQRLQAYAAIVLVMTRWHPDDIIGKLFKEMLFTPDADQWRVLSLPTVAPDEEEYAKTEEEQRRGLGQGLWLNLKDPLGRKPGEVLWPSEFSPEIVANKKANMTPADWMALHMQTPRARTGGFFKSEWPIVDQAPANLQWFRLWDLAVADKKKSDQTCSAAIAFDNEGNLYVRDMVKWRAKWPTSRQKIIDYSKDVDPSEIWGVEQVAFQLAAVQELLIEPDLVTRAIYGVVPEDDKTAMALPLQSRQDLGKVALVRGPWNRDFMEEAALFPRPSVHDDQIDTITKGMQLYRYYMVLLKQQQEKQEVVTYDERVRISPM